MNEPRILIVEDVRMIAEYMELVLLHQGYHVVGIVNSGEEAVVSASRVNPDIVLMDIKLDGAMDGIDAAARMREHADIPVIFVTAYTERAVFERAMAVNPSAYLHKPFKGHELIDAVQRTLDCRCGVMTKPGNLRLSKGAVSSGP